LVLIFFTISATLVVGFARGPWWGWLLGGAVLAFLHISDPRYLRPSLAEARLSEAFALLRADLRCLSASCMAAAGAFAAGRVLSWALPL
jgi:hypothetical protein